MTKGVGKHTTAHLNLTVSLAEVWAEPIAPAPVVARRKMGRPPGPNLTRPRYAGDERYAAPSPRPSTALHWSVPAFPNRFAAKRRTFKD